MVRIIGQDELSKQVRRIRQTMKDKIHPTYHTDATVTCVCGNTFTTGSTQKEIHVEVCSQCHPFYTGKQKLVDTAGRVEKFKQRAEKAKKKEVKHSSKTEKYAKKKAKRQEEAVEK